MMLRPSLKPTERLVPPFALIPLINENAAYISKSLFFMQLITVLAVVSNVTNPKESSGWSFETNILIAYFASSKRESF